MSDIEQYEIQAGSFTRFSRSHQRQIMSRSEFKHQLPGYIASGLIVLTTTLWMFWGTAEMYYEGWGAPFPAPLAYLIPGAICLAITLVGLTWPRLGGWLIIVTSGAFTAWFWGLAAGRGQLTLGGLLSMFPISGMLVVTGALFLFEGNYRRRRCAQGWAPPQRWLSRNLRYVLALGCPLLVAVAVSVYHLPILLTRVDDGDRSPRLVEGNGVTLVWAPEGPGWSMPVERRYLPGWADIALYGVPPVGFQRQAKPGREDPSPTAEDMRITGLCRYLSADGLTLMSEAQDVWRMPTTDEIVRSLVRHGKSAGCAWSGKLGDEFERANCEILPDKETPLWVPSWSPIYYWSADEYDKRQAYYVSYNGGINHQPKSRGNPRHGYRCVREP